MFMFFRFIVLTLSFPALSLNAGDLRFIFENMAFKAHRFHYHPTKGFVTQIKGHVLRKKSTGQCLQSIQYLMPGALVNACLIDLKRYLELTDPQTGIVYSKYEALSHSNPWGYEDLHPWVIFFDSHYQTKYWSNPDGTWTVVSPDRSGLRLYFNKREEALQAIKLMAEGVDIKQGGYKKDSTCRCLCHAQPLA